MVSVRAATVPLRMISRTSAVTITQSLKEHVILGTDARDIQAQKDRWLAENPSIKIIEDGDIKREPQEPADAFWRKACATLFHLVALSGRGQ